MRRNDDYDRGYDKGYERGSKAAKGGVGFFGLLTIVFITLKLLNVINWSWIWVLAPLWCPPILAVVGILLLAAICYFTQ